MTLFLILPKKSFSEQENRMLASFPKFSLNALKDGNYIEDLETYLNDHFLFRDFLMGLKTTTDKALGKKIINNVYIGKDNYLLNKYEKGNQSELISKIQNFKNNNPTKNINLLILPSSTSVYKEKLPNLAITDSEEEAIEEIYQSLDLKTINVYDTLVKAKDLYQIFYKTDHHYTTFGAYYTYRDYCLKNNLIPFSIDDFVIKKVSDNFYGTLYSKTSNYQMPPDDIYLFLTKTNYEVEYKDLNKITNSLYDYSYLNKKDKYSIFLNNNHGLITITNKDIKNNKELLVIKDSFGNSLVPFLSEHYKKIYVVDLRYNLTSMTKYLEENSGIQDVLIVYNITSLDKNSSLYYLR